jgi:hypothetical protein
MFLRIEKVRGSIPLSSTPGQMSYTVIFTKGAGPWYSSKVQQRVIH